MDILRWVPYGPTAAFALLGKEDDGVLFSWCWQSTCYRRGPWKLLVEVITGPHYEQWGCFDSQDQPLRYYHSQERMLAEAEAIATVLLADRNKHGEIG